MNNIAYRYKYGYKIINKFKKRYVENEIEMKIIKFIIMLRHKMSVRTLNRELKQIVHHYNKEYVYCRFYDDDDNVVTTSESTSYIKIADLLNSYEIPYNKSKWTAAIVSNLVHKYKT